MKSLLVKTSSVALLGSIWTMGAFAQPSSSSVPGSTSPAKNTSVAAIKVNSGTKYKLPVDISYLGIAYGPSLSNPVADYTANTDNYSDLDQRGQQQQLWVRNILGIGHKVFDSKTSLSANLYFGLNMTDNQGAGNRGFFWKDSYLRLGHSGLAEMNLKGNKIALDGDVRYYAPTSKVSRENGTIGAFRLSMNPSVQFGKSMFSVSAVNYAKVWAQGRERTKDNYVPYFFAEGHDSNGALIGEMGKKNLGNKAMDRFEFYTGPQLNAQLTDRLNAFLLFETYTGKKTDGTWLHEESLGNLLADFNLGTDVKINDNLAISPFLQWYPSLPMTSTSMNLTISASL